jgi:hypothetical protein
MVSRLDVQAAGRSSHQAEEACPAGAVGGGGVKTLICLCVTLVAAVKQEPHESANQVGGPRKCGAGSEAAR